MNFFKKNWLSLLLIGIVCCVVFIPKLGDFVRSQILLSPTVTNIKNQVMVTPEEYNIELHGINTSDINLKNLRGKNVFLNFWGTWCPPCRAEWPSIQKLKNSQKNLNFVLVAMQDQEDAVKKFLAENKYDVPVYIATSPIPEKLLPNVFPTTFLISGNGQILKKEEASKDWFTDQSRQFIETAIR